MIFALAEIVAHARRHSAYYRNLYSCLPPDVGQVAALPIVDQNEFWAANTLAGNQLLTGPLEEGIVFKSGGTTGVPKFSAFTREEWDTFTRAFGRGMATRALRAKDRVANLFYAGDLYASFLFIMDSIERAPVAALQLPISGSTAPESVEKHLKDFRVTAIAGVPTTLINLAERFAAQGTTFPHVERLLYGGEALYPDQMPMLKAAFPEAEPLSIGYASVDAGLLGYADASCENGEHLPFLPETILEIVDEDTGAPITKPGVTGKVLITSLTRKLMPILRYPAGDLAAWVEPGKRFKILGRSEEGARVGPVTVYAEDIRRVLNEVAPSGTFHGFQIVLTHETGRDRLEVRAAVGGASRSGDAGYALAQAALGKLHEARPMLAELAEAGKILPTRVTLVAPSELETNARTGKMKQVLDRRRPS